eukprot:1148577-Pelagomonas_calceolata.AAC.11
MFAKAASSHVRLPVCNCVLAIMRMHNSASRWLPQGSELTRQASRLQLRACNNAHAQQHMWMAAPGG